MSVISALGKLVFKGPKKNVVLEEVGTLIAQKGNKLVQEVVHPIRTQSYYDNLADIWNKGISYYNPKTNKTLYTSAKTTHIFDGQLPNSGPLNNYAEIGNAKEQLKLFHSGKNDLVIWKRKPNNYGIMSFLTTANSTETRYYACQRGLISH